MKNKKDSLQKFIDENRAAFDELHPPHNAWTKIEKSLSSSSGFWNSLSFWRAAAVFLLALSIFLFATKNAKPVDRQQEIAATQMFNDMENYYGAQIIYKMNLVHRYQTQTGRVEDDITQDLRKLDAMYDVLKNQMKQKPTQEVADALVLNLLVRIDLINQQLHRFDQPTASDLVKKNKEI